MIKGAVRSMSVVVLDVDPQRTLEVALADDEQPVQSFSA